MSYGARYLVSRKYKCYIWIANNKGFSHVDDEWNMFDQICLTGLEEDVDECKNIVFCGDDELDYGEFAEYQQLIIMEIAHDWMDNIESIRQKLVAGIDICP